MQGHPEQRSNETWVGNHRGEMDPGVSALPTARLGEQAYYIDGRPIPREHGHRPLFIGIADASRYNDIMMTRTFGPNWRQSHR